VGVGCGCFMCCVRLGVVVVCGGCDGVFAGLIGSGIECSIHLVGKYVREFTWIEVEIQGLWSIGLWRFVEMFAGLVCGVQNAVGGFAFKGCSIGGHGCGLGVVIGTLSNRIVNVVYKGR